MVRPLDRDKILRDFKPFFLTQTSERSLKKTVKRDSGARLCLGFPEGWWLTVVPRGELVEMSGRDLRPILPTAEWVVVLGEISSPTLSHTSLYMAMGRESRLFVYSALDDALTLAANDLDEFSHIGLSAVEFVFRIPSALSTTPGKHDTQTWNDMCRCTTGHELVRYLSGVRYTVIGLRTPGKQEHNPLILLDRFDLCCEYWPLSALDKTRTENTIRYISKRMCSRWYPLGISGIYRNTGVFHVIYVIIFDDAGAIFYLSMCNGELWRLADNVRDLRHLGLLKVFTAGRRVDREYVGMTRLEHPPDPSIWFHSRKNAIHLCDDVAQAGETQLVQQHAWITRDGRANLLSEDETFTADMIARLSRLDLSNTLNGAPILPKPNVSSVACSQLKQMIVAMWNDDDSWRPDRQDGECEDGDLPPFRENPIPSSPERNRHDLDQSPISIAKRRVLAASRILDASAFHAPIIEPLRDLRLGECGTCQRNSRQIEDALPVAPPSTPIPAPRRRKNGLALGNIRM